MSDPTVIENDPLLRRVEVTADHAVDLARELHELARHFIEDDRIEAQSHTTDPYGRLLLLQEDAANLAAQFSNLHQLVKNVVVVAAGGEAVEVTPVDPDDVVTFDTDDLSEEDLEADEDARLQQILDAEDFNDRIEVIRKGCANES